MALRLFPHCIDVDWPANGVWRNLNEKPTQFHPRRSWMGSLLRHGRDASGQYYRRNRYYDASSGRFTQEDPIGLAGGMNLYGFANGDPISYSDPYGLCPNGPEPCPDAAQIQAQANMARGVLRFARMYLSYQARGFAAGSDVTRTSFNFEEEGQFGAMLGRLSLVLPTARGVAGPSGRAAASAAGTSARITLAEGDALIAVVGQDGQILTRGHITLSHEALVARQLPGGVLPEGAQVVTIGKHMGQVSARNSRRFHDNQAYSPDWVQKAVRTEYQ